MRLVVAMEKFQFNHNIVSFIQKHIENEIFAMYL